MCCACNNPYRDAGGIVNCSQGFDGSHRYINNKSKNTTEVQQ